MTTIVKKIIKNSYPLPADTLKLCKSLKIDHLLPKEVPKDISFELHKTTVEVANAIRRCANSEVPVLIMDFEDNELQSDDPYIITHEIRKRINLIPIKQIANSKFKVDVYNDTDAIIPVYSKDIVEQNGEKRKSDTFIVTYLRPLKRLTINNIQTVSGVAYLNGVAHSFPGKVMYECLDDMKESSLNSDPSSFKLTLSPQKHTDPTHIIKMTLETILKKIQKVQKSVEESKGDLFSEDIEISYVKGKGRFKLINETYTIGNLLSKYGYLSDKSIKKIHCVKPHPSSDHVIVEIHHDDPKKIMLLSTQAVVGEFNKILKAFS